MATHPKTHPAGLDPVQEAERKARRALAAKQCRDRKNARDAAKLRQLETLVSEVEDLRTHAVDKQAELTKALEYIVDLETALNKANRRLTDNGLEPVPCD